MNQGELKALKKRLKAKCLDDDGKALCYAIAALPIIYGFVFAVFALF